MFRRAELSDVKLERRDKSRPLKNILVTGGLGFIGSNFINHFMLVHPDVHVYNYDKMDYCSNEKSIDQPNSPFYHFIKGDITCAELVMHVLKTYCIDTIINFAAESHVDNSFGNSLSFTYNNVYGTHVLLECARVYEKIEKFIHVSTDEVYGQVGEKMSEEGTLNPTNPYAATKAAVEYIVKSYHLSFGLPCIITRGNNVYGPRQFPEKIIPRFIMLHHAGKKMTIQGDGSNTRTFIHVDDVARAFILIVDKGIIGDVYNIGSADEKSVMDIARLTIKYLRPTKAKEPKEPSEAKEPKEPSEAKEPKEPSEAKEPSETKEPSEAKEPKELKELKELEDSEDSEEPEEPSEEEIQNSIAFVRDRDFNDQRYDISSEKLAALGWRRAVGFDEGFRRTVRWYVAALDGGFWSRLRWDIANSESALTHGDS